MKIFILQKMTDGVANAHFENKKSFSDLKKAIKYCIKNLELTPLDVNENREHLRDIHLFLQSSEQRFAKIKKYGVNNEIKKIEVLYRIQHMELE